jgi:hypothetical protein
MNKCFSVVLCGLILGSTGCAPGSSNVPRQEPLALPEWPTPQEPPTLSKDIELACAEGIIALLRQAIGIGTIQRSFGAVFFQGVPNGTILLIQERVGTSLPKIHTDLASLDQNRWIDRETGRVPLLVWLHKVDGSDTNAPVFSIFIRSERTGCLVCGVYMKKESDAWKVIKCNCGAGN